MTHSAKATAKATARNSAQAGHRRRTRIRRLAVDGPDDVVRPALVVMRVDPPDLPRPVLSLAVSVFQILLEMACLSGRPEPPREQIAQRFCPIGLVR